MRFHHILTASLIWAATFSLTQAQEPAKTRYEPEMDVSLSAIEPTPEMWLYVQERRRHEDPKEAVRRKAQFRASQRQQRIAAMKAYGYSKQRPLVYHSPFYTFFTSRNDFGFPVIWPSYSVVLPTEYPVSD
jgi:hypothetical protein